MIKAAKTSIIVTSIILQAAFCYAANSAPRVGIITPSHGLSRANTPINFTTTYTDRNGSQDINSVYFLMNTAVSFPWSFYVQYSRSSNRLYLMNDAGTAWLGGYAPGSINVIENSYAKLDCSKTVIHGYGNTLLVNWDLNPKASFAGAKNTYLYAVDKASAATGWVRKGTWEIRAADTTAPTGTITINRGETYAKSASVTLTLSAKDDPGGSGLSQMRFSNDNITWSNPEAYAVIKRWTLSSGNGLKTVYVKFSDKAGNWSAAYSDTITLTIPTIIIKDVSDSPDPFSPNGDGYKDTTTISAVINTSYFNRRMPLVWKITISDSQGNIVKRYVRVENIPADSSIKISYIWNGAGIYGTNKIKEGKYTYLIDARIYAVMATQAGGDVTINLSPQLNVTVSPDYWNVGAVNVDSVITMNDISKLTVTNGSDCRVNYSLCLVNPVGWSASQSAAGSDTYVLNAAFSSKSDTISWNETNHALSIVPVAATAVKFAGDMAGVNVAPEERRPLWLQFKAPAATHVTKEQNIEVVINAQAS